MERLVIRAALAAAYTLTGTSRDAGFSPSGNAVVGFRVMSNYDGGKPVRFKAGTVLNVTRARLVSSGAPGLHAAPGKDAADLRIHFSQGNAIYSLAFADWNEWEPKALSMEVGATSKDGISMNDESLFTVDDFGIHDDFVGQSFVPVLELEVESGSVVSASTGAEY